MTIRPYDIARKLYATGGFDWATEPMSAVIPKLGYVPDLASDIFNTTILPYRSIILTITSKVVTAEGWLKADVITFASPPTDAPVDQVIIFKAFDGVLIFNLSFPPVTFKAGDTLNLMYGSTQKGLCRL